MAGLPASLIDLHRRWVQTDLLPKPSGTCCPQGKGRGYGALTM